MRLASVTPAIFAGMLLCANMVSAIVAADAPKTRRFVFIYEATMSGLAPGKVARVWTPVPPTNDEQQAALITKGLPANFRIGVEPKYGNQILFAELPADARGTAKLSVSYRIERHEVLAGPARNDSDKGDELFLKPDAKVPVGGKPLMLLEGHVIPRDGLATGRLLYDVVNNHMRYSKEGTGWGQGDAVWACDSKYGNCSDFHSLFISLARAKAMPAKFEMGFPLPDERGAGKIGGYHCWARFKPAGKGWVPVDISEANKNPKLTDYYFGSLSENRVAFSTGRDLTLVPNQDGPPLNFFIYPYVEVNGKPYADTRVERSFAYRDLTEE
jgi:hypothetical protein